MPITTLNPTMALVSIDLQKGIVALPVAPHPAEQVVRNTVRIAQALRAKKLPVILVHVSYQSDGAVYLRPRIDAPTGTPNLTPEWSETVPELGSEPSDIVIIKHQWGAFYGTDLDVQLRRRGITDIILTGIATNLGVESTARDAWEHGYNIVIAEDAISGLAAEDHTFAVTKIFPRIAQIDSTEAILQALTAI